MQRTNGRQKTSENIVGGERQNRLSMCGQCRLAEQRQSKYNRFDDIFGCYAKTHTLAGSTWFSRGKSRKSRKKDLGEISPNEQRNTRTFTEPPSLTIPLVRSQAISAASAIKTHAVSRWGADPRSIVDCILQQKSKNGTAKKRQRNTPPTTLSDSTPERYPRRWLHVNLECCISNFGNFPPESFRKYLCPGTCFKTSQLTL